jgi:hypothetical protein
MAYVTLVLKLILTVKDALQNTVMKCASNVKESSTSKRTKMEFRLDVDAPRTNSFLTFTLVMNPLLTANLAKLQSKAASIALTMVKHAQCVMTGTS